MNGLTRFRLPPAVAVLASLWLAAPATLCSPSSPSTPPPPDPDTVRAAVDNARWRRQEQSNRAILNALDQLDVRTRSHLRLQTKDLQSRLDVLERSMALRQDQQLRDLLQSNRAVLHTTLLVAGLMLVALLLITLIPLRALNRTAVQVFTVALMRHPSLGTRSDPAPSLQRLAQLERRLALATPVQPKPSASHPPAATPSSLPRPLGLVLGEGASIGFLPSQPLAGNPPPPGMLRRTFKKWFPGGGTHPSSGPS